MKHQNKHSFVTDDLATQIGGRHGDPVHAHGAVQIVSEMADDAHGFRSDVHKELTGLVATYKLPPMPEATARHIRASAGKILEGIMLRSFESNRASKVS